MREVKVCYSIFICMNMQYLLKALWKQSETICYHVLQSFSVLNSPQYERF